MPADDQHDFVFAHDPDHIFQEPVVNFQFYLETVANNLLSRNRITDAACSLTHATNRYGWNKELLALGQYIIEEYQKQQTLLHYATDSSMRVFSKNFTKAVRGVTL
ncbi:hypothetical protein FACS1894206_10060 [Deltaproteobacteria bacterium]|nr:hypothetical protein FACS1894206_10060 [Deltaproteobacteria bacterium]